MDRPRTPWYRMDNASFMYSSIQRDQFSAIYRFSAVMTERVDPVCLQAAVDKALPRFPGFAVKICRGFFWYYFEPNTAPGPYVREDVADPCRPVRFNEDSGWLIRFYYYRNRISLEVFHALADGAGALCFFKALLARIAGEKREGKVLEEAVEPPFEGFCPARGRNQPRHVVRDAQGVFPRCAFVEKHVPPCRVPRALDGQRRVAKGGVLQA